MGKPPEVYSARIIEAEATLNSAVEVLEGRIHNVQNIISDKKDNVANYQAELFLLRAKTQEYKIRVKGVRAKWIPPPRPGGAGNSSRGFM